MINPSDIIFAEGDTGIALFHCGACKRAFRAELARVTLVDKQPICLPCIEGANPKRKELGFPLIPFSREAYAYEAP